MQECIDILGRLIMPFSDIFFAVTALSGVAVQCLTTNFGCSSGKIKHASRRCHGRLRGKSGPAIRCPTQARTEGCQLVNPLAMVKQTLGIASYRDGSFPNPASSLDIASC